MIDQLVRVKNLDPLVRVNALDPLVPVKNVAGDSRLLDWLGALESVNGSHH